uniref:LRAT domain-containing protein n=1 Tax=Strongyloides venezuelensis TaxID=75913 RepID=A0A0K0EUY7_STRVS
MNYNIQTPWTSAKKLVDQLEIGDLIEIKRNSLLGISIYKHWAVYVGCYNGFHEVVHFSNKEGANKVVNQFGNLISAVFSIRDRKSSVRIDNFFNVCGNDKCRINNSMDKYHKPLPVEDIRSRALSKVGDLEYCVLSNNCEHLVKWTRYDLYISDQGNLGKAIIVGASAFRWSSNIYISLAVGGIYYLGLKIYDYYFKKGSSRDSTNSNHSKNQLAVLPA